MTKTICIDKAISNDDNYIIDIINNIEKDILSTENINYKVYINSLGGNPFVGVILYEFLNQSEIINKVELIAIDYIESTAFDIFYNFKGKRSIVTGTLGMYHHCAISGLRTMGEFSNKKNNELRSCKAKAKCLSKETIKKATLFCTKKELSIIEKGNDCYFSFERMTQIFKNAKII
jgi:ATP-dependent protease ClpP protease subunit